MKLNKERISNLAVSVVSRLQSQGMLEISGPRQGLVDGLDRAITEELSVEDRLNAEVRQLLKAYEAEIERGHVDYQKMFTMIKKKLVQERGIIL
jgi:hypothetical protein